MARVVVISVAWLIAAQNGQQAEPVTKIVDTLQNVFANLNEEHKSDETTYKKFYDWCQGNFVTRKNEHQRFKTGVSELQSKLQVQQAQNKQLKDEAGQLEEEVKQTKEAIAEATSMRQQEHQDYLREESNFAQVLQSLNRGVDVLQSSTSKQALLQVTNSLQQLASQSAVVTDAQRDQLQQFAQRASQTSDDEDVISQSSSVVQVLHELINNFQQSAAARSSRRNPPSSSTTASSP
jgi:chromosome segregation ATPase